MNPLDPRHIQISLQSCLIIHIACFLGRFSVIPLAILSTASAAIIFLGFSHILKLGSYDTRSSIISGLSIAIMLQVSSPLWIIVACFIAIASKFIFRSQGSHFINPSNFAISALLLLEAPCWLTLGSWNQSNNFLLLITLLAIPLLWKIKRMDLFISYALAYGSLTLLRNIILENPWHIFLHHFFQGSHLIFALLMLTDPVATPHSRFGRIVFSCIIASLACYGQHILYIPDAPIYALFIGSFMTPIINKYLRGSPHQWQTKNLDMQAILSSQA